MQDLFYDDISMVFALIMTTCFRHAGRSVFRVLLLQCRNYNISKGHDSLMSLEPPVYVGALFCPQHERYAQFLTLKKELDLDLFTLAEFFTNREI